MIRIAPLLPLFAVASYFFVALALFTRRAWRHQLPVDAEVEGRPASPLLGRYLRHFMMWVLAPYERLLVLGGVSPNAITLASLAVAAGAAVALARGWFGLGGWLYLLAGILDILDGRVARSTGRESRGGAFFDSVIDRYAELAIFAGLAVFYRGTWVLGAVLLAAGGSLMVSYARARGEALGVDVRVGTMQRPERLFYLGVVVAHSPLWDALQLSPAGAPRFLPAVAALGLLGVSSNVTAIRRIFHTLERLAAAEPAPAVTQPPDPRVVNGLAPRRLLARWRTAN